MNSIKTGFTLIEVMIVISIIITISSFSIMVYSRNTREQRFDYEVSRYVDLLNFARQNALINNTEGFQCPNYFGHKIKMHSSLDGYSLQICCFEDCDCDPVRPSANPTCEVRNVQDYNLHTSVQFEQQQDVRFRENARGTGETSVLTATLRSETLNKCTDITVTSTGLIQREKSREC